MKTKDSRMIETAKNAIVSAIKGSGDVVQATVNAITQMLSTTIKDSGKVGTSL